MSDHWFESAACDHSLHEECPKLCPYCPATCRCRCHHPGVTVIPPAPLHGGVTEDLPGGRARQGEAVAV